MSWIPSWALLGGPLFRLLEVRLPKVLIRIVPFSASTLHLLPKRHYAAQQSHN